MKQSTAALFPHFYDDRQTASTVTYVAEVDPMLLEDGTYFVIGSGEEMVACGGWSRRDELYTGSGDSSHDGRLLDPQREPARVRAMFVRPDWTRRGLGRRILEGRGRRATRGLRPTDTRSDPAGRTALPRVRVPDGRRDRRHDARRSLACLPHHGEADTHGNDTGAKVLQSRA